MASGLSDVPAEFITEEEERYARKRFNELMKEIKQEGRKTQSIVHGMWGALIDICCDEDVSPDHLTRATEIFMTAEQTMLEENEEHVPSDTRKEAGESETS